MSGHASCTTGAKQNRAVVLPADGDSWVDKKVASSSILEAAGTYSSLSLSISDSDGL